MTLSDVVRFEMLICIILFDAAKTTEDSLIEENSHFNILVTLSFKHQTVLT